MKKANNLFARSFLALGLAVQVIAYFWMPAHPMSLVSGLLGICSVVLCSEGNILTFVFGFGQIITYTYLCYLERFYAGIAMNAFYFVSQIYGIYSWRRLLKTDSASSHDRTERLITPRTLSAKFFVPLVLLLVICSVAVGKLLSLYTDDTQPYFDAFTTVPAIAAQILMVTAYKEQWYIWFAIDILYVIMWAQAGNACMLMQYAFWCANCIYGFVNWKKAEKESVQSKLLKS